MNFDTAVSHRIYLKDVFQVRSTMFHPAEFELQHALHNSQLLHWLWVRQFVIVNANYIVHTVTNAYVFSFRMPLQIIRNNPDIYEYTLLYGMSNIVSF